MNASLRSPAWPTSIRCKAMHPARACSKCCGICKTSSPRLPDWTPFPSSQPPALMERLGQRSRSVDLAHFQPEPGAGALVAAMAEGPALRVHLKERAQYLAEQALIAQPVPVDDLFVPTYG